MAVTLYLKDGSREILFQEKPGAAMAAEFARIVYDHLGKDAEAMFLRLSEYDPFDTGETGRLKRQLSEKNDEIDTLRSENDDLEDENTTLRTKLNSIRDGLEDVAGKLASSASSSDADDPRLALRLMLANQDAAREIRSIADDAKA